MDADFLKELDDKFSNVGREVIWKKKIGEHTIWFSPPAQDDQMKINETMSDDSLGIHIFSEVKKRTLAYSIVGIDDLDLTQIKVIGPVKDPKTKKPVNVPIDKFIYVKVSEWGAQFVDDAFKVFADLMETHEKDNLKDITFENLKDPAVELAEAEARVDELRQQLGVNMPSEAEIAKAAAEELEEEEAEEESGFDPFKPPEVSVRPPQEPEPEPEEPVIPVPHIAPSTNVPEVNERTSQISHVEKAAPKIEGDPSNPQALPSSKSDEVIDKSAPKIKKEEIKIDQVKGNRNPRFQPAPKV
jgi:hypothetical protein